MNVSNKKVGLGIVALAVALLGSAAIADSMDTQGKGGPGMTHRGQMGMMAPIFNFAAADADKDGKVTAEEFAAYRASTAVGIDTDNDGKISVDELAAMNLKAMEAAAKSRAERMVKALDTDGDGKLSAAELVARPMPADAFTMMDTNHDGVVDQAEMDAAKKNMMRHGRGGMRNGNGGMGDGHGGKHHKMPGTDNGMDNGQGDQTGSDEN
ncbi:MAG: EF-hand domain-containing protein [Cypionkella sp.]